MTTINKTNKKTVWDMTLERLDESMELLNLSPGLKKYLREPRKVLEVAVTVKMDNGDITFLKGTEYSITQTGDLQREVLDTIRT